MRVFEEDPKLLEHVEASTAAKATRAVSTPMVSVAPGSWEPEDDAREGQHLLGLLVLQGFLCRRWEVERNVSVELLGPGDLLRPGVSELNEHREARGKATWHVITQTKVAVLDRDFQQRTAVLDGVAAALMARLSRRTCSLAERLAIVHSCDLEMRVYAFLWYIAARWGEQTSGGIMLPVPLEHRVLADLVCARRQSVTTALGQLQRQGALARRDDGRWTLSGRPDSSSSLGLSQAETMSAS